MKKAIMALAAAGSLLASCTNESIAFDDFERQTIYMPYQYPVAVGGGNGGRHSKSRQFTGRRHRVLQWGIGRDYESR